MCGVCLSAILVLSNQFISKHTHTHTHTHSHTHTHTQTHTHTHTNAETQSIDQNSTLYNIPTHL